MANNQEELPRCLVCSQPATKRCSGCHEANYCSTDHQRQHWKQHKKTCSPYQVVTTDTRGRHAVSSRQLPAKSLVLQEPPLVFAPMDINDDNTPICLACCVRMSTSSTQRCARCHWPVCSRNCEKVRAHMDNECTFFSEKDIKFPPKKYEAVYGSVLLLRLLLLKGRNKSQWKKFMEADWRNKVNRLWSHPRRIQREQELIYEHLVNYFGSLEKLDEICGKDELEEIVNRLNAHTFLLIRQEEHRKDKTYYRGVYLKANYLSHGCISNCVWAVCSSPNFDLCVRTAVSLDKLVPIELLFDEQWTFVGTYQRQVSKFESDQTVCNCSRCLDKTECGSYISAIRCTGCFNGYLLPENPVDLSAEATWRCSDKDCGQTEEQEKVISILHHSATDMEKVLAEIQQHNSDKQPTKTSVLSKLKQLDELHETLCETRLHPHHFLIRALEQQSIALASSCVSDLSFSQLDRCILYCERLLTVCSTLAPGYSRPTASLQRNLCQFMLRKKVKAAKEGQTLTIFASKKSLLDYLYKLDKLQQEVLGFYEVNAESIPSSGATSLILKEISQDNSTVLRDIKLTISSILK